MKDITEKQSILQLGLLSISLYEIISSIFLSSSYYKESFCLKLYTFGITCNLLQSHRNTFAAN